MLFAADFFQRSDTLFIGACLPKGKVMPLLAKICLFINHGDISIHKNILSRDTSRAVWNAIPKEGVNDVWAAVNIV